MSEEKEDLGSVEATSGSVVPAADTSATAGIAAAGSSAGGDPSAGASSVAVEFSATGGSASLGGQSERPVRSTVNFGGPATSVDSSDTAPPSGGDNSTDVDNSSMTGSYALDPNPPNEGTPISPVTTAAQSTPGSNVHTAPTQGLGTFTGVFRPTVLTILGVMAYLRLGWVVGEAGLFGAFAIFILIYCITLPTALSLSSITTNIRLGSGGVFAIISRSLGLETGGAIGIPLYLAQALSGALYIYGFAEGWQFIFPHHPIWAPLIGCYIVVSITTAFSTKLAFKLQGIVLFLIISSMLTIFLGVFHIGDHVPTLHNPPLIGKFETANFWELFAVIFPAGTGLMVGVTMSGALQNPRKSVPIGTIAAVLTSFFVYVAFIIWYSIIATPEQLTTDFLVSIKFSAWRPAVLAGILGSTFTAALSSLSASPRILYALALHKIMPFSDFLSKTTADGTPRNASYFTMILVGISLSVGSLNRLAVLITIFFLITYLTINIVLLIEQSLGMISFRPMLKIPMWVAALGAAVAVFAVVIISPTFAVIAMAMILAIYIWLSNKKLESPWETVRSSIFVALADWAARRVASGPSEHNERSWKPDILVPVRSRTEIDGNFRFLRALAYPKGSVQMVGFSPPEGEPIPESSTLGNVKWDIVNDDPHLKKMAKLFRKDKLYATSVTLDASEMIHGVEQACAILNSNYSPPSIVFSLINTFNDKELSELYVVSKTRDIGLALLCKHPQSGLGRERIINVWIRNQDPDWNLALKMASIDIALLLAYQLSRNWNGQINLITIVENDKQVLDAEAFLNQLVDDARLPKGTQVVVRKGVYLDLISTMPQADLQIVGLSQHTTIAGLSTLMFETKSSVLAVHDSGRESVLA